MEAIAGAAVFLVILVAYLFYDFGGNLFRVTRPKDLAFIAFLEASSPEEFEESYRGTSRALLKEWVREFRAIEKDIERLVAAGGSKKYSKSHLRAELARRHPSFRGDALDRAVREIVRAEDSK